MSYVFRLFPPRADGDLRAAARASDERDDAFAPVDPAKEAAKLRIAKAIAQHLPDVEVTREGYDADAPSRTRCFEINDLGDDSFGLQIQLFDDEASLTVPYWHTGDKAAACFDQVWTLLGLICTTAGYAVYDTQLKRPLEDGESNEAALAAYTTAVKRVTKDPDLGGRKPPKPKWKK